MIAPPARLDKRVQQFVSDVSGLVEEVEGEDARQARLLAAPNVVVYSHVDAATGRAYYFDSSRQLSVWQPPAAAHIEQWTESAAATAVTDQQLPCPLTAPPTGTLTVERLLVDVSQSIDRLTAAVSGQTEAGSVSAALLRLELRIRREDWQAGAVSDGYVEAKLRELLSRTEQELAAVRTVSFTQMAEVTDQPMQSPQMVSSESHTRVSASDAPPEFSAAVTEQDQCATSDAAVTAAPPPGVRRRAGVVSRPPSNLAATLPTISIQPPPTTPTQPLISLLPPPPAHNHPSAVGAGGSKRRLEDSKGAVGAMVQRWKAVRREAEGEGDRLEQERLRLYEQRMRDAESSVRSSGGAAHNPNLIEVASDWQTRIREKQLQQQQ